MRKGPDGLDELLIADNLSDDVLLMNGVTGKVLRRFDLSQGSVVPSTYPVAIAVNRSGSRAYVALWNGSAVAELDLNNGKVVKKLDLLPPQRADFAQFPSRGFCLGPGGEDSLRRPGQPGCGGRHACRRRRTQAGGYLRYPPARADLFWRDAGCGGRLGGWQTALCRQHRLRCHRRLRSSRDGKPQTEAVPWRWVPTEWYPTALAVKGNKLYVATAKGQGTGPNNMPQPQVPGQAAPKQRSSTYIATLLHGSLAAIDLSEDRQPSASS